MENLESVHLLPDADELDGHAADPPYRKGGAAAGIAVHLGEYQPGNIHLVVELLGHPDGVLPGHGIDDEYHLIGLDRLPHPNELRHQFFINMQPPGGVDDNVGRRQLLCL